MDAAEVESFFGTTGPLASLLKGYAPRQGQVQMAVAVAHSLEVAKPLLVEAGTGTGKGLAYAVPASHWAASNKQRVVIVTANIALQEQLVRKDLPIVSKAAPWKFQFSIAKGIGNYACLEQLEDVGFGLKLGEHEAREQLAHVRGWVADTTEGDVSELPFELRPDVRRLVTTSSDECLGAACPSKARCFALSARRGLHQAQVIVTNYHLFYADLKIKASGGGGVLPEYGAAVLDEAHEAADVAREFFGFRLTEYGVKLATKLLAGRRRKVGGVAPIDTGLEQRAAREASDFFDRLRRFAEGDDYDVRLKRPQPVPSERLTLVLQEAADAYRQFEERTPLEAEQRLEVRNSAERCQRYADDLASAMALKDRRERVYFIQDEGQRSSLRMKPISVARLLATTLFDPLRRVVCTSATLTARGTFGYAVDQLGADLADVGYDSLQVPSPFDYSSCAALCVPRGLPDPNDSWFAEHVAEHLAAAVAKFGGGVLGLFTSYAVLDAAHKLLVQGRACDGYNLMRQGDAPRTQLAQRLRDEPGSVLLGTESFWQGLDVPGDALRCVVVDRLPFEPPSDPVADAVTAASRDGWRDYVLPRAIQKLCQGFGRLIRTTEDRGVVVVLDRRIVDKGYGRAFVASLPDGLQLHRTLESACAAVDWGPCGRR